MNDQNQTSETRSVPVKTSRVGLVRSAIWARETETGTRYSARLECRYKDAEGNWQSKFSYDLDELLAVREAANRAIAEILNLQDSAA